MNLVLPPSDDHQPKLDALLANRDLLAASVTLEFDVTSLLGLFGAAHLGLRHPALAGSEISDVVTGLTHHVAAELAAANPDLEPLAAVLLAGLTS